MSKKTADKAKKAVEENLKSTEDRLDEILRRLRERCATPTGNHAEHA
jgi:hypothetical protein